MVKSMTGFAAQAGEITTEAGVHAAHWELRAVNGRGLDLRFRLPEGLDGLEAELRRRLGERIRRGSVTLSLKLGRVDQAATLRLNGAALGAVLAMLAETEARAEAAGFALAPMTAADILGLRGVVDTGPETTDSAPLVAALLAQVEPLVAAFDAVRVAEGAALSRVLESQLAQIEALHAAAVAAAQARRIDQVEALRAALARLSEATPQVDQSRLEQELALIAVRTDITEELDRLAAHCDAARTLLAEDEAVGRKLDFLMQEFNREANTLCSKSQSTEMTRIGLDLKTVIDQMREQVQNLE